MQSGKIPNGAIRASSKWDRNHGPERARLHIRKGRGKIGAWSARQNNRRQWLQIDLRRVSRITMIATQGRQDLDQWVEAYKLSYSLNGRRFMWYRKVFAGNYDRHTVVVRRLRPPILARYIRFYPLSWHGHISMRVELYGKRLTGRPFSPLGMENGFIPNNAIRASSKWDRNHGPENARLNRRRRGRKTGAWSSRGLNRNQWIQIDLRRTTLIKMISTQGRQDHSQWVTSYSVEYSQDGKVFRPYKRNKIFAGNFDRNTIITRSLRPAIRSRYIRIKPYTWVGHISLRFELYGKIDTSGTALSG
ncbi:predicted protein [Nematostella vectensis]|uniref:F5/8 type C domain-containing protein n=1 Tax=Nematostella vectensis TaxID=45351 RepID=A7RT07_NEMVE|nr:predicted protein [Nematostella vectensis]|eukprot:XP_001637430.1 predicted protein [Nematostella vectensis]